MEDSKKVKGLPLKDSSVASGFAMTSSAESDSSRSPTVPIGAEGPVTLTIPQKKKLVRNLVSYVASHGGHDCPSWKKFDFSLVSFDGLPCEVLREEYKKLRTKAFGKASVAREIALVASWVEGLNQRSVPRQKRPRCAYVLFIQKKYPKMLKQNPNVQKKVIFTLLAKKWRDLAPEKKAKYEEMAREEKAQFVPENENHTSTINDKFRPKTAIQMFRDAKRRKYSEKYGVTGAPLYQLLNKKFKQLSQKKKEKWERKSFELIKQYVTEVTEQAEDLDEAESASPDMEEGQPMEDVSTDAVDAHTSLSFLKNNQYLGNPTTTKIEPT